jgi:hypothetical protein
MPKIEGEAMKWKIKRELWGRSKHEGRKNGHILVVNEYAIGFERKVLGYYFVAYPITGEGGTNSLWRNQYWPTIEEAKMEAENWADKCR